jgi:hypothetical protein
LVDSALRLLITLGTAIQKRSMLFSDEQKLLLEGWKNGFINRLGVTVPYMEPFISEFLVTVETFPKKLP